MINAIELAFIPGLMLGIEFPHDNTDAFLVIDLIIVRIIWWRIDASSLE